MHSAHFQAPNSPCVPLEKDSGGLCPLCQMPSDRPGFVFEGKRDFCSDPYHQKAADLKAA
jgi:hypothetical protein